MDDFSSFSESEASALLAKSTFEKLCKSLNLTLNPDKMSSVSSKVDILGGSVDLLLGKLDLTKKLHEYRPAIRRLLAQEEWTTKDLEKMTGRLEFLTVACVFGRSYTIYLVKALALAKANQNKVVLNSPPPSLDNGNKRSIAASDEIIAEAKAELSWWLTREEINTEIWRFGRQTIVGTIACDANKSNFGLVLEGVNIAGQFESFMLGKSICWKELEKFLSFIIIFGLLLDNPMLLDIHKV